jgi:hypothetical protein
LTPETRRTTSRLAGARLGHYNPGALCPLETYTRRGPLQSILLLKSQSGEGPDKYREPRRFEMIPSRPIRPACRSIGSPQRSNDSLILLSHMCAQFHPKFAQKFVTQ